MTTLKAIRLGKGDDLKQFITDFFTDQKMSSGVIVSAVGSLSKASLRMAGAQPDAQDIRNYDGHFEIVSLTGTVAGNGLHLHMAISDSEGVVFGGHLKEGCLVDTTVELVIASDTELQFKREVDQATGFDELTIIEKNHD